MPHPHWPLLDLEVRTPTLTLRYIDDDLGAELVDVILRGVHDPAFMPFGQPFTDAPRDEIGPNSFRFWARCRAGVTPDSFELNFAVVVDGHPVGATGLGATHFPALRSFETGSWLGRDFQGRGLGTELRLATLHLGFVGLDARFADTGAFDDNGPSLGVTRKLGYEPNGSTFHLRRGERAETLRFRMDRDSFMQTLRRDDIEIVGDGPVRDLLGLTR